VRIALRLKGLVAEMISLDLLKGDQFDATYRALNPEMVVPTLIDGDGPPLVQSLAILEYLGEKYPQSPLLPADLHARAHARGLAQMLAMDAHPFIVPRVRKYLEQELHLEEPARMRWLTHWLDAGSRAIEDVLARDPRTGRFCCGDHPTSADICLVAHLTSAKMLCDRSPAPYPTARRIFNCLHGDRGICSGTPAPAGRRANDGGDMTAALIVVYVILGILYESRGN
jgi:maleylacetoacetate isomerase/maleylpyruvate isomerase